MLFISIIFLTILIPSTQSAKPTLKLTFGPEEKYYTQEHSVDISCEIINPNDPADSAQLWHVDLKTGKRTSISRTLLKAAPEDSPDIFKQNKNGRLEYLKKNYLRITRLQMEDSARYECNCPDCEESLGKQTRNLQVTKLVQPKWHIEPPLPIQEGAKTTLKCVVDDFYPYVSHRVIRNHHEYTKDVKTVIPTGDSFPQKFSWETSFPMSLDWHNNSLQCFVLEGNHEQHATQYIEVLFAGRLGQCETSQHVDSSKEKASISCTYAGNPAPKLTWLRQSDEKPITSDPGITIETKDEHHGKYKSIVTFDRERLIAIPLITTTTKTPTGAADTTVSPKVVGENYYQQLLSGGFIVKLNYNNEDKVTQKISITSDATQGRANIAGGSARATIETLSASIIFFSVLILTYMIHHH